MESISVRDDLHSRILGVKEFLKVQISTFESTGNGLVLGCRVSAVTSAAAVEENVMPWP